MNIALSALKNFAKAIGVTCLVSWTVLALPMLLDLVMAFVGAPQRFADSFYRSLAPFVMAHGEPVAIAVVLAAGIYAVAASEPGTR